MSGESGRGFGGAARGGRRAAGGGCGAFCDWDGSLERAGLPALLAPVMAGTADLVLGSRQPQWGSWPLHARSANYVLAWLLRRRTGEAVTDLGPMRAARRADLLSLQLEDRRSGYPLEMFLKASLRGWRITELPVVYAQRTGKSKVTGTVLGTVRAVRDMSAQLRAAAAAAAAGPGRTLPGGDEQACGKRARGRGSGRQEVGAGGSRQQAQTSPDSRRAAHGRGARVHRCRRRGGSTDRAGRPCTSCRRGSRGD